MDYKPLSILYKFRFGSIVIYHSTDDLAGDTHTHMFHVAVIAHHILKELIPGGTATSTHPCRRDTVW